MSGFWHGLLLCLFWAGPVLAADLHLSAEQVETDPHLKLVSLKGQARIFAGDYRITGQSLTWDQTSQSLLGQGEIEVQTPDWTLKAAAVSLALKSKALQAQKGSLSYHKLRLHFDQASLNPFSWVLKQVKIEAEGIPGYLEAESLTLYPESAADNLQALNVHWNLLPIPLPNLQFSLPIGPPPAELPSEIRAQTGWFSPSLNLVQGGLAIGSSSRLYQDSQQRLYARLDYHPLQGWLGGFSHEWRQWGILNTEILGLSQPQNPLRGHVEWQGVLGSGTLRSGLHWQESSLFLNRLLLPPLKNSLQALNWHSDHLYLSDWFRFSGVRLRSLAGLQISSENWLGAGSLQAISQPWIPFPQLGFQASGMLNLLAGNQNRDLSAGLRILGEWTPHESLILGDYFEQYLSSLPGESFAQAFWLQPRNGLYAIWKITPDLALGGRIEWVLPAQEFSGLEALLTLRQGVWVLNLLAQAIPAGVQVQIHSALF